MRRWKYSCLIRSHWNTQVWAAKNWREVHRFIRLGRRQGFTVEVKRFDPYLHEYDQEYYDALVYH